MCQLSQFLWNLATQLIVIEPQILQGLKASQLTRQPSRQAGAYEAEIRHQPLPVAPGELPVAGLGALCFSEAQGAKHPDQHLAVGWKIRKSLSRSKIIAPKNPMM